MLHFRLTLRNEFVFIVCLSRFFNRFISDWETQAVQVVEYRRRRLAFERAEHTPVGKFGFDMMLNVFHFGIKIDLDPQLLTKATHAKIFL